MGERGKEQIKGVGKSGRRQGTGLNTAASMRKKDTGTKTGRRNVSNTGGYLGSGRAIKQREWPVQRPWQEHARYVQGTARRPEWLERRDDREEGVG